MTPSRIEREQRVRNGSRRKRDLAAAGMTGHPHLDAQKRSEELWDRQAEWSRRHLPDEEVCFVIPCFFALQKLGIPITPENVMQRLRNQGKDKASMEEDA